MVDRLKGITLEIGGDTTKLSKALSGVNSDIINTKAALKDVERLLKLDPGNVELLRQKQKLLATSVKETSEKLKTLKAASEQAAKTADKYDAWKAAYDPIQKEIESTNKALLKLNAQQKEMQDCGEIDTEAYKQLQEEVENSNKKLRELREQAKAVTDEFGNPISPEQFDSLQREIVETENNLKNLQKESRDFGSVFTQQLDAVGDKLTAVGGKITDVGKKVSVLSGAVTAAGIGSAKLSMDFEDAMAKVSTIADTSQMSMEDMETAILNLSTQTGVAATDIANNVYDAISAGQNTADAVSFVGEATKLARAGFADTASALDILTTILNSYGLEASDVTDISRILIMTQNLGKTTVAELASAMGKILPTAYANGLGLTALASSYAVMTSNGIATAETTTYLNSMLNELGKSGSSAEKAFRSATESIKTGGLSLQEYLDDGNTFVSAMRILGDQADKTGTSVANMFGSAEAGKAATVLINNIEKIEQTADQIWAKKNPTDEAYAKLETNSFRAQKSINELKNVAIQLGDSLMQTLGPIIDEISEKIRQFSEWFAGLSEGQKETIVKIGLVVAAAGPLLIIIGQVLSGIGSICHAISSTGPAISFFSEKVLPVLSSAFSGILSFVTGTVLPGLSSAISGAFSFITGTVLPGLASAFSSVFTFIAANPIVLLIAAIVALVALIATKGDEIQAILQKVDDFLQGVFATDWTEVFGPVLGGILNTFFATFSDIWDSIKQVLDGVIDIIRGVFTNDWERVWEGVKEIFSGIFTGLEAIAEAPLNGIIGFLNAIIDGANWCIEKLNQIPGVNLDTIGDIPFLAKGGTVYSGSAVVGDAGPEILTVAGGKATVTPLTATVDGRSLAQAIGSQAYRTNVQVSFTGSLSQLATVLQPAIVAETERIGGSFTR